MVDGSAGSGSANPRLELVRVSVVPEGAFGVLLANGIPALVTLERTYPTDELRPRGPQYVKIPAGRYVCRRTLYHAGGYETYEITGVVGHDRLLFHKGNLETDSEGCILVGQRFGWLPQGPGVLESAEAWARFMRLVAGDFTLAVRGAA